MDHSHNPARPAAAITRRGLFQIGAMGAALAASPVTAQRPTHRFTHGVASGEPGHDRVLLWTRYVAPETTTFDWQVSENLDFTAIVSEGSATTSADTDWCAKCWADNLRPARWYYYRFIAADGTMSETGRTRTLPESGMDPFRIAVFSCSNFGFGYFNAYAHAAEADDFELAVHLGDYIYEYKRGEYPSASAAHPDRTLWPVNEIVALADYRQRYSTYRADPDLRRIHQLVPMIAMWDDHESANDSWTGGAENHQPDSEGEWEVRKAAAKRAWREWMPVSDETYARYDIGDLATLVRLDTRLEGREQPFSLGDVLAGQSTPDAIMAALATFRDGAWASPDRTLLGMAQEAWLADELRSSRSGGKRWQVIAQQVVMGRLTTPPDILDALGSDSPAYIRQRVGASAMAGRVGLPFNMDAWDGYPAARERLLAAALEADANLVVLAGDSHNAWASQLSHGGENAGVEFAVQSVSSPGFEAYFAKTDPARFAQALVAHNDGLRYADTARRGYSVLRIDADRVTNEYRFLDTVRTRSTRLAATSSLVSAAGLNTLAPNPG